MDSPTARDVRKLTFLLRPGTLPPEDTGPLELADSAGIEQLFGQVNQWATESLLSFRSTRSSLDLEVDPRVQLECLSLEADKGRGRIIIDTSENFCSWRLEEAALRELEDDQDGGRGIGSSPDGFEKGEAELAQFAESLAKVVARSESFENLIDNRRDRGGIEIVPIFRWEQPVDGVAGELLGFWLRDAAVAQSFSQPRLEDCRLVGVVADEVAGRGMRDIITSLLLLGVVSAPLPNARAGTEIEDGRSTPAPTASREKSSKVTVRRRSTGRTATHAAATHQEPAKFYNDILSRSTRENTHIVVSIAKQRVFLMVDNEIAVDSPISSGRVPGTTPTGTFTITLRDKNHISSTYHCPMPYYLRLADKPLGLHVGQLPGYPASHGCIRLLEETARVLYEKTALGTSVTIEA